ncbi:MAG: D-glycero-beta-D-manno-heptose-7-phosphate kinase [Candidatus Delongbacteria bacterium]|nr:D-glycero-beta-D-manno-heptose-7-phosphate kinase [Candidatus Delongbacteria bacterium]MBN2836953.1 D-glycero-beta-D-manno-heptose-7-phosphate kinase [Candidatus Delongbacteria bacterium]
MIRFTKVRLFDLIERLKDKNIAVIGDIMADVYIWGKTNRISPEAPVPVVDVFAEEFKLGGAANVALNLKELGCKTTMFGVIGCDKSGDDLLKEFLKNGIDCSGIVRSDSRKTTTKTRIVAAGQHVVRYDRENRTPIDTDLENEIISKFRSQLHNIDALIIEDYNKGLLTENLIKSIVKICKEQNIIVTVDPKFSNINAYSGVTLFKPNLKEAEGILNRTLSGDNDLEIAGNELINLLNLDHLVITLSERGMALFEKNSKMLIIPAKSASIANVSGAGDTVIATLTIFLAAGANFQESCSLANYAASVVVEDVSVVPIQIDSLVARVNEAGVLD